jgi:hypothetical protein
MIKAPEEFDLNQELLCPVRELTWHVPPFCDRKPSERHRRLSYNKWVSKRGDDGAAKDRVRELSNTQTLKGGSS